MLPDLVNLNERGSPVEKIRASTMLRIAAAERTDWLVVASDCVEPRRPDCDLKIETKPLTPAAAPGERATAGTPSCLADWHGDKVCIFRSFDPHQDIVLAV
jgi:hypothetical protein